MSEIENLKIDGGSTYTVGNQDIVANEWEASKTYVKDKSYVTYEHGLYVCNTTHTSVSPIDLTKWTAITVGEAIAANTTAIGSLSTLTTSNKSSLVGAVNEVNAFTDGTIVSGDIGANISFSRYKLWKCNGIAHINANIAVSATIAGTSKICDLPSGFGAGSGVVYDFTTIDTLGNTIRGYLNGDRISFNFVGNVQSGAGVIFQITWKVA